MQDLLDVASIEAGRLSIEAEPQSVNDLIESGLELVREQAAERNVALKGPGVGRLPLVEVDGHRVQQVLGNLIGNALKFTPPDGCISVFASYDDREVTIHVNDTGPGIPAADLPHVFDRFWHARRGAATRGTGLGLAIVQGIVRAHGGRVWADSVVGVGSTFSFTLPVYRAAAGIAAGATTTSRAGTHV
jgi:signal transduction histidine kinase